MKIVLTAWARAEGTNGLAFAFILPMRGRLSLVPSILQARQRQVKAQPLQSGQ